VPPPPPQRRRPAGDARRPREGPSLRRAAHLRTAGGAPTRRTGGRVGPTAARRGASSCAARWRQKPPTSRRNRSRRAGTNTHGSTRARRAPRVAARGRCPLLPLTALHHPLLPLYVPYCPLLPLTVLCCSLLPLRPARPSRRLFGLTGNGHPRRTGRPRPLPSLRTSHQLLGPLAHASACETGWFRRLLSRLPTH